MATKKASASPTPYTFISGLVQDRDTVRVTSQIDEISDAGSTATQRMRWHRSNSRWSAVPADFRMVKLAMMFGKSLQLFAISPEGSVSAADAGGDWEEEVDASKDGPSRRGEIRDMRVIDGVLYCAGMSRQVYRRIGRNKWKRMDAGVIQSRGNISVSGFNSIDGVSNDQLFAAGFNGEIWCRSGDAWTQMASPTNVVLNWIRVIAADRAFCAGQQGVLLEWDGILWKAVDLGGVSEDIWSVEWFRGNLFLATDAGLYRLSPRYKLEKLKGLPEKDSACRELHARSDLLVSTGPKHVWITEDGDKWQDITP